MGAKGSAASMESASLLESGVLSVEFLMGFVLPLGGVISWVTEEMDSQVERDMGDSGIVVPFSQNEQSSGGLWTLLHYVSFTHRR